jgi:high affinity Mn2+ porin
LRTRNRNSALTSQHFFKYIHGRNLKAKLRFFSVSLFILSFQTISAQSQKDTVKSHRWNIHFQQTVITQYHPTFAAAYSDTFSLQPKGEAQTSLTSTLFMGAKMWKGAEIFFNPEIAGGSGLSLARGVAGFPNGETFRIGNPKPQIYLARLFLRQYIALSQETEDIEDDANQLPRKLPISYLSFTLGKFSIADFFDNNRYSHDARNQFMNWALMSNGAWDYPANTRGYTVGFVTEFVRPGWAFRISSTMVPTIANGNDMDHNIKMAKSETAEFEKKYKLFRRSGTIRALGFYTQADMGNYRLAVQKALPGMRPDITQVRSAGRIKYGFGINIEQSFSETTGMFARASWNDGKNETWAFTEIDQAVSIGISVTGKRWQREEDVAGLALLGNGISQDHRNYLKNGGHGFMVGDGNLNYAPEIITEFFYNFHLHDKHFWISPDYQFIINPAYNMDRGPVHVFSLRLHSEF